MAASTSRAHTSLATGAVLLLLLAAVILVPTSEAQLMDLERYGNIVAGQPNQGGFVNGPLGTNYLLDPFCMCGSYLSSTEDPNNELLLIGTARSFRTFNRTSTEVGDWFGGSEQLDIDGPLESASAATVYGCAKYDTSNPVIYYVTGTSSVHYVHNDNVYSHEVANGIALQDIALYDNYLYMLSLSRQVFRCVISTSNPAPVACTEVVLSGSLPSSGDAGQRGITVNSRGLFIATATALSWFSNPSSGTATLIQQSTSIAAYDVHTLLTSSSSPVMFVITSTSIYSVTLSGSSWSITLFAGTGTPALCTSNGVNMDGPDPTFCGLYRLYIESEDEMYFTLPSMKIVRSLTLPPMEVNYTFYRHPFPIGFWLGDLYPSEDIMAALLSLMDSELNGLLGTSGVMVERDSGFVEPEWWNTQFTILVPQRDYDLTLTKPAIEGMTFDATLLKLADYYNLTDELIYTDFNILPTCSLSKMNIIEHDIASRSREALNYSLIYTNPGVTETINGNPNITYFKLLMPSPFGSATASDPYNMTTPETLATVDFADLIIEYVRASYSNDPEHVYNILFSPESEFPFKKLSPEKLQQIRWIIRQIVEERLRECARVQNEPEDGGQGEVIANGDPDLIPGCVPQIGITNQTYVDISSDPERYNTGYTIFIPDTMNYSEITKCLDGTDWSFISDWIGNNTATKNTKCDTGCIVAIAVVSAVVACVLIVILVVLISKRMRLATVVAPGAAGGNPEFSSTIQDDESLDSGENPLVRK